MITLWPIACGGVLHIEAVAVASSKGCVPAMPLLFGSEFPETPQKGVSRTRMTACAARDPYARRAGVTVGRAGAQTRAPADAAR
ncbi:hypothetical protein Mro02_33490 [Microbispora rosea subsp. aerata]|nr:hypothetical protein Mro02_33490 [Microbispora rosea subsp. aerata]GLJ84398.1 hypothetical protein GCM10017588_31260 [Microbispora rosea subsp. aerata]